MVYRQTKYDPSSKPEGAKCEKCGSKRLRWMYGKIQCYECEHVLASTGKYRNQRQTYKDYNYDSKFEANVAASLDLRKRVGDIKGWERQKVLRFYVSGTHICDYKVDFVINHNDGTIEFLEAKGVATPVWKLKWRLLEALHEEMYPGSKLSVVRQSGKAWETLAR